MRIYLDTCIYIDYLEDRKDNLRPLGLFAYQIFKRALECEFVIVISPPVLKEIEGHESGNGFKSLIESLRAKNKLSFIAAQKHHYNEARDLARIRNTTYADTLHALLARESGAEILVTRNLKDFEDLCDIIPISYPESL